VNRTLVAVIALGLTLGSGIFLWRSLDLHADRFDPTSSQAAGEVIAESVANLIHNRGRVLAVLTKAHLASGEAGHAQWTAFQATLKKYPGIVLLKPEVDPPNTDGLVGCSSVAFNDILQRNPETDAIIFWMPLPPWVFYQNRAGMPTKPVTAAIIVVETQPIFSKRPYGGYFAAGLLSELVVPRSERAADAIPSPKKSKDRFHNEFQIFTPQNYESLPE